MLYSLICINLDCGFSSCVSPQLAQCGPLRCGVTKAISHAMPFISISISIKSNTLFLSVYEMSAFGLTPQLSSNTALFIPFDLFFKHLILQHSCLLLLFVSKKEPCFSVPEQKLWLWFYTLARIKTVIELYCSKTVKLKTYSSLVTTFSLLYSDILRNNSSARKQSYLHPLKVVKLFISVHTWNCILTTNLCAGSCVLLPWADCPKGEHIMICTKFIIAFHQIKPRYLVQLTNHRSQSTC